MPQKGVATILIPYQLQLPDKDVLRRKLQELTNIPLFESGDNENEWRVRHTQQHSLTLQPKQIIGSDVKDAGDLNENIIGWKSVSGLVIGNQRFSNAQSLCQLLLGHFLAGSQLS